MNAHDAATHERLAPRSRGGWIVGAGLLAAALASALLSPGDADAYSRALSLTRASGYGALASLCCALCVTPLARLARRLRAQAAPPRPDVWVSDMRRALGVGAGGFGLSHAALAFWGVPGVRAGLFDSPQLRAGLAAWLILTLLLVTSFPRLVRLLRIRRWKELHRLAYVALPFAFLHALLGPFAPLPRLFTLIGATLAIGVLRYLPRR